MDECLTLLSEGEQQWDGGAPALTHTASVDAVLVQQQNRNSGEPDYRLIDLILLKHYKQSHQQSGAQSEAAHIGRTLDIN